MCRKFRLLYNIENTSIQEICVYLRRTLRVFLILIFLDFISLITDLAMDKDKIGAIIAGVSILLYLVNIYTINLTRQNPTETNAVITIVGLVILSVFNIFALIYNVLTGSLWGLTSLIGVILQWTSIYLIYKLREKIVNQNASNVNVVVASAINPTAPMAEAYAVPASNNGYGNKANMV